MSGHFMLKYTEDYQLRTFTSLGINYIIYNKILNRKLQKHSGETGETHNKIVQTLAETCESTWETVENG